MSSLFLLFYDGITINDNHGRNIFTNQTIQELKKQRHINQCIAIRLKYAHSSVDIGNDRYTKIVSF